MNVPNKITLSRICLIPVFMIFLLAPLNLGKVALFGTEIPAAHLIATAIFIIASVTDFVDGYYARKYNLITNFGKFLDPLADKLLVCAAFISLVELGMIAAWMVIIIISREFIVTGIRLVAAADGAVIAASPLGKLKTVFQLVACISLMLYNIPFSYFHFPFATIMVWMATILTLISGIDYFMKNKHIILSSK